MGPTPEEQVRPVLIPNEPSSGGLSVAEETLAMILAAKALARTACGAAIVAVACDGPAHAHSFHRGFGRRQGILGEHVENPWSALSDLLAERIVRRKAAWSGAYLSAPGDGHRNLSPEHRC